LRLKGGKDAVQRDGKFVIEGNLLAEAEGGGGGTILSFGLGTKDPRANAAGASLSLEDGKTLQVNADGSYVFTSPAAFEERGQRVSVIAAVPPSFTTENYKTVLTAEGIGRSFLNSLTVAIPSTIIPILIAAFAAYALSWMELPKRVFFVAVIVALLVVPLQLSLIPLLKIYNQAGNALGLSPKGYLGIWLAHTGFGLPFAIYLFRSYIAGLPKDLIESAKVDGANDFRIFMRIVLPLSFPVLASFAIFQFLWTWNDLLVAMVFLGTDNEQLVLTGRLNGLLGSRGGNWEILTTSAFITIIVPLVVFFSLQRYFVRGLLAGSVKGG
jgi:alpha-glucoside transport system permease protein